MVEQQGTAVPAPPAPFNRFPAGRWLFERWIGLQLWGLFVLMAPVGICREAFRRPRVLLSFAECRDVAFGAAWAIIGSENAKSNAAVKRRLMSNVRMPRISISLTVRLELRLAVGQYGVDMFRLPGAILM